MMRDYTAAAMGQSSAIKNGVCTTDPCVYSSGSIVNLLMLSAHGCFPVDISS